MVDHLMIVTDVTLFNDIYCVAGWDVGLKRMIRPEPPNTKANSVAERFWPLACVGAGKIFSVGNLVKFVGDPAPQGFAYPHATEDVVVRPKTNIQVVDQLSLRDTANAVVQGISKSIADVYDNQLIRYGTGTAYVPNGSQSRSLGALEIAPDQIVLHVGGTDAKPKLRAMLDVGNVSYDLSVPAVDARDGWLAKGITAFGKDVAGSNKIHLRLGLSRPWPMRPNECFAQVNGLYLL